MLDMALSFEFFPPKTEVGLEKLHTVAERYLTYKPEFFSVTFGAGGSTQQQTPATVAALMAQHGVAVAPHISCMSSSRQEILSLLQNYQTIGAKRLVVLRGDRPSGMGWQTSELRHASDLVSLIRQHTADHFDIDVAAYPECHPEAASLHDDVRALKMKQIAGANRAMTQYFFNIDSYYHYCELCQQQGVTLPIIPGIMPITNFDNLRRFSARCEAEMPRWLVKQMSHFDGDIESQYQVGLDVVTHLCEQLIAMGVSELHFYTLNGFKAVGAILQRLGISVGEHQSVPT